MNKSKGCLLTFVGLTVLSMGLFFIKYYGSYYWDLYQRPWAYSSDKNTPLLVGKWQGNFKDPDNVAKQISLTIFEPTTDEERWEKAGRRSRNRQGKNLRAFDGVATVISKIGKEEYEIWGSVMKEDYHQLHEIHFRVLDEKQQLTKNFNVQSAMTGGQWSENNLILTLGFTFTTATGSGYWSSADPRFDKKVRLTLIRQTE